MGNLPSQSSHQDVQFSYAGNRKKLTNLDNRLVVARGRGVDGEFGISRCKLLYIEWINNMVLLDNIGNYMQYPVIIMGKNMKSNIFIYV